MNHPRNTEGKPTVTAVVTSCKRFDLLEETLKSFVEHNTYPLKELLIVEDSAEEGVYEVGKILDGVNHRVLLNGKNLGQIASIDRAYAEVDSDYIFHLEDDWRFTRTGFIERAIEVLEHEPNVILANVRTDADMPRYVRSLKDRHTASATYKRTFPELHFLWHTFTFNPGLRRRSDYLALGNGYKGVGDEAAISRFYKAQKRDMAWLKDGGVLHTGDERSTYGTGWGYRKSRPSRSLRKLFSAENIFKWRESLRRRFWHSLRLLGIDTEPMQRRR